MPGVNSWVDDAIRGRGAYAPPAASAAAGFGAAGTVPYTGLANNLNTFMTGQAQQPYIANLPNYQAMVGQQSQNTLSQLQGQVPQDVVTQLLQRAAERGIISGAPGSASSNSDFMRSLGLTSIGQQATGAANLHQNIADTPVPELFSPASLFIPQTLAADEYRYARAGQAAGTAAAAPANPWTTGYDDNSARYGRMSNGALWG